MRSGSNEISRTWTPFSFRTFGLTKQTGCEVYKRSLTIASKTNLFQKWSYFYEHGQRSSMSGTMACIHSIYELLGAVKYVCPSEMANTVMYSRTLSTLLYLPCRRRGDVVPLVCLWLKHWTINPWSGGRPVPMAEKLAVGTDFTHPTLVPRTDKRWSTAADIIYQHPIIGGDLHPCSALSGQLHRHLRYYRLPEADTGSRTFRESLRVPAHLTLQQRRPKRSWPHSQSPEPSAEWWTRAFTRSYLFCAHLHRPSVTHQYTQIHTGSDPLVPLICAPSSEWMPLPHIVTLSTSPPRRYPPNHFKFDQNFRELQYALWGSPRIYSRNGASERTRSIRLHVLSSTLPFFSFLTSHRFASTPKRPPPLAHNNDNMSIIFATTTREGSFGSSGWVFHQVETLPRVTYCGCQDQMIFLKS